MDELDALDPVAEHERHAARLVEQLTDARTEAARLRGLVDKLEAMLAEHRDLIVGAFRERDRAEADAEDLRRRLDDVVPTRKRRR